MYHATRVPCYTAEFSVCLCWWRESLTHVFLCSFAVCGSLRWRWVINQCFDIKTSNHIWTSCSNVCFLSYFCSTQMFFYHSFILYFYFYCTPCGSNYFYIPWIYITFTFLCSFPILFHFHSSLISDILYQPRCCFLCCVFNVNVVYICRSEMGRALPDLRKKQTPFWLSFICLISW